ncbi:MAG: hypothetical protein M3347_11265 [Armatimonadota bacterium]|nr:hypothetical protein [Armatimonadota bacterium]
MLIVRINTAVMGLLAAVIGAGAGTIAWSVPADTIAQTAALVSSARVPALAIREGLPEGTFEQSDEQGNPLGWKLAGLRGVQRLEENGNHFLRLTNDLAPGFLAATCRFQLDPKWKRVKVGVRMRASNLKVGAQAHECARLASIFEAPDGVRVGDWQVALEIKQDSAAWIYREIEYAIPAGAAVIKLSPEMINTTGIVDFDDMMIEGDPPLSKQVLRPGFPEGTFEELDQDGFPIGWRRPKNRRVQIIEEKGNHFLRLTNDDPSAEVFLDSYWKLDPQWQGIKVSARLRAQHLKTGKQPWYNARLGYGYTDATGKTVGPYLQCPELNQDSDWKTVSVRSTIPAGALYLHLRAYLQQATGTFDLDDIRITEDTSLNLPRLLLRAGFPEGKFEEIDDQGEPAGWKLKGRRGVELIAEDGNHFLRLANANPSATVAADSSFKLDPLWKAMHIRVRMRARDLEIGANPLDVAQLRYTFEDAEHTKLGRFPPLLALQQDADWTTLEAKVLIPEGAFLIRLMPMLQNATGVVDIDDIAIDPIPID